MPKLASLFAAGLAFGLAQAVQAQAPLKPCACAFSDSNFSAYGTKAACTAIMFGGNRCEIVFGGTGQDPKIVSEVAKEPPDSYRKRSAEITVDYLRRWASGDVKAIADPAFLRDFLPFVLRSAYLRPNPLTGEELRTFDTIVVKFVSEKAPELAERLTLTGSVTDGTYVLSSGNGGRLNYLVGFGFVEIRYSISDKPLRLIAVLF